jgi:hypothetical protein
MDTKEIVALTEKWLEKIQSITVDYNNAVGELTKVREDYNKQTKKWYNTVLPYLIPLISIIILLIAFGVILHFVGCPNPIDIKFQDLELTQTCK